MSDYRDSPVCITRENITKEELSLLTKGLIKPDRRSMGLNASTSSVAALGPETDFVGEIVTLKD